MTIHGTHWMRKRKRRRKVPYPLAPYPPPPPWSATPHEIVRSIFPEDQYNDANFIEHIIWGETGYPSFWHIPQDGKTPEECFRRHVWNARARRELRYYNIEITEEETYLGQVRQIKAKSAVEIICADGTTVSVDEDGHASLIKEGVAYYETPLKIWSPYIFQSDIMGEFFELARRLGMTKSQFLALPLELFVSWLVIRAAQADGTKPEIETDHPLLLAQVNNG